MVMGDAAMFISLARPVIGVRRASIDSPYFRRKFKAFFAISLRGCLRIWLDVRFAGPERPSHQHLLWALHMLKQYPTEEIGCRVFGVTEKTYRHWTWLIIKRIARLDYIQWERRFENWEETVPSCSVDGVDFWVPESHPFSRGDYSHKLNHAGLRYHVALALGTSFIVHVAGGVRAGSWPDLRLARECLVPLLRPGEMVAADRGYRDGALYFLTPVNRPISLWQRRLNRSIRLIQARHEHVNKRLDDFSVLGEMFRHSRRQHRLAFAACAMLTQVNLIEEPLVDVRILLRRRQ